MQLINPVTPMQTHLPDYLLTDLLATVAFGVVAILLIVLGYITFDKLTPKLNFATCSTRATWPWRSSSGPSFWVCAT